MDLLFLSPTNNSNLSHPSYLVIPKPRDLQCALRLSPIFPEKQSG